MILNKDCESEVAGQFHDANTRRELPLRLSSLIEPAPDHPVLFHRRGYEELLLSRLEIDSVDWLDPEVILGGEQAPPSPVLYAIRRGCWSFFPGLNAPELRLNPGDVLFAVASPGQALRPLDFGPDSRGDAPILRIRCHAGTPSHPFANSGVPPVFHLQSAFTPGTPFDESGDLLKCVAVLLISVVLVTQVGETPPGATQGVDPDVAQAILAMQQHPGRPWTVESLAQQAAMSRAAFAKRFADLVGEPPLAYVTRWRMDLAAKFLRESREPVARIAGKVGYLSETAFAKAFRRRRKMPPGAYRYQRSGRVGSGSAKVRPNL